MTETRSISPESTVTLTGRAAMERIAILAGLSGDLAIVSGPYWNPGKIVLREDHAQELKHSLLVLSNS